MSKRGRRRERPQNVVCFDNGVKKSDGLKTELNNALRRLESRLRTAYEERRRLWSDIVETVPAIQEAAGLSDIEFRFEDGFNAFGNIGLCLTNTLAIQPMHNLFWAQDDEYNYIISVLLQMQGDEAFSAKALYLSRNKKGGGDRDWEMFGDEGWNRIED